MRWYVLALLMLLVACDVGVDDPGEALVVEAFFNVGAALPDVTVRRTVPLEGPYPDSTALTVAGAEVRVTEAGVEIPYGPVAGRAGRYRSVEARVVRPETAYRVEVVWRGQQAVAETRTPPRLRLDSLRTFPFAAPVRAVLLDSLRFDTLGTGAREGYVFPVEVVASWPADGPTDSLWVRSLLQPAASVAAPSVEVFFPPERIVEERSLGTTDAGRRVWRGLYAVPVSGPASALPPHRLRVALVRSGRDYARFAATRGAPARREPIGNVVGGRGIVAGLSIDSLTLVVQ